MVTNIVSDALNTITNAIRARKDRVVIKRHSKLLLSVLAVAQLKGYVKEYKIDSNSNTLLVILDKINQCQAINPRYVVGSKEIEKFIDRFLPAKNIGVIIISTSQGLMTHQTALDKNIGGSLIAYIY